MSHVVTCCHVRHVTSYLDAAKIHILFQIETKMHFFIHINTNYHVIEHEFFMNYL